MYVKLDEYSPELKTFDVKCRVVFRRQQCTNGASKDHVSFLNSGSKQNGYWVGGGTEILYNDFWSFVRFEYYRFFCCGKPVALTWGIFRSIKKEDIIFVDKILWVLVLVFSTACTQKLSYKALIHI